jgi:hypothetical protein
MDFLITQDSKNDKNLNLVYEKKGKNSFKVFGDKPFFISNSNKTDYLVFGYINGIRLKNGKINDNISKLKLLDSFKNDNNFQNLEGRFVLIKIKKDSSVEIKSDKQAKKDVYILKEHKNINISSRIDYLPTELSYKRIDSVGLMQATYIYGGRPLKKQTLYENISRLGVLEKLIFNSLHKVKIKKIKSKKRVSVNFKNKEKALNDYSDRFIESVRANASKEGNIVFLSSGWDSTSILATLVHLFGKSKTRAVIGRMKYSKRSNIANVFEMKRAKKMADYFGIKLDIVDLDYTKDVSRLIHKVKKQYKPHNFANITGFNHWLLAEKAKKNSIYPNEVVFAGEMSDGAHNFGFSQYASIFHPSSFEFREYSDKMASYLFGPTFLKVLISKEQNKDPVWNLFKNQKTKKFFEDLKSTPLQIKEQFLKSFFLRAGRIPLAKNNSKLLSSIGRNLLDDFSTNKYLKESLKDLDSKNLYSKLINLYESFHWQGATVATLYHACESHNLKCSMPFHDSFLLEFLSDMPESWGRGLELKPTKYPLKWMLKNRINYPMELQKGAHSYTYDIDPSFSHVGELVNHSFLGKLWRKNLSSKQYLNFLDIKFFNHSYIEPLIDRYVSGEELFGEELTDVYNIAFQDMINFS